MNTKNTWTWLVVAVALFASILLLNRYLRPPVATAPMVLPDLSPASVTSVSVIPAGALEIRAEHANDSWLLASPVTYPAQSAAIETLLAALQKLAPAFRISASELNESHGTEADFGFDLPQFKIVLNAGVQHRELLVGNRTPPGNQVYLRVVGVEGTFVTDVDWLKFIPHSAADWRSTALVAAGDNGFDSIVLTNGAKGVVIELHRDATNHLWRMIRPLQARADSDRITGALQQLQAAQAVQFITDDTKADLTAFGLQPAALDLWLARGTNFITALHIGKSPTNDSTLVYANRERWSTVFTTAREPLLPWFGSVNDFRDPHLLELGAPVVEIEVRGTNGFSLQLQGTNKWKISGEKFPADAGTVQQLIKTLADLRVAESGGFVQAAVTAPDLVAYGLAPTPAHEIVLRSAAGDSNAVIAQLAFAVQTNGVFVHRADEDFIYAITPNDFNNLQTFYGEGWRFRDHRVWNFSETNVAQITLHQNGQTRQLVRNGVNKWSLAPGSQGIINPPALEETAHRLGEMTTAYWVGRNLANPEENYGLNTNNQQITVELKNGEKFSVAFGTELPTLHTALAAVTLDGERWAFIFPPPLYQFVWTYLRIPASAP